MAPKAKNSMPVVQAGVETESPPKTKGARKRPAPTAAPAAPKPNIFQLLKKVRTEPAIESIPTPMQRAPALEAAPPTTAQEEPVCESAPAPLEVCAATPVLAPAPMEVSAPTPGLTEREATPAPMQVEAAAAVETSEHAHTSELKVGNHTYTCVCTRDPGTAAAWAARVTQDVDAAESSVGVLGMDCEWAAAWHRAPGVPDRVATLQLFHHGSCGRRALVFSIAGLGDNFPPAMAALLGDPRVAKVGVNVGGDASRLVRDFGHPVRGLFDLSNLNKKAGQKLRKGISLEDLVQTHCPEDMHISKSDEMMSKGVRTGNWEAWPLSAEQIEYAAKDAALGVMAFMMRFGMDGAVSELSKEAVDSLVSLEEVNADSMKAAATKKSASKKNLEQAAGDSTEPTSAKKSTSKKKGAEAASKAAEDEEDGSPTEEKKKDHANFFIAMRNSVLKAPNIGKKDHPQGPKNALAGVCIIVSGILDSFERKEFEEYVKGHGGTVSKGVTGKVTHLVTDHGEAGPSKAAKCKELGIPMVSEDVILKLVSAAM